MVQVHRSELEHMRWLLAAMNGNSRQQMEAGRWLLWLEDSHTSVQKMATMAKGWLH